VTQPTKPDAAETISRLEARIAEETAALDDAKARQRIALIGIEQGAAGAEDQADTLAKEVRQRRDRIAALDDTLIEARKAQAALSADSAERGKARERERLKGAARKLRKAAAEVDEIVAGVGPAVLALREAAKDLWEGADGPTRTEALGELPRLLTDLPMVIHERLAHGGVLASRSATFDRCADAPSAEAHLDIALREIVPPRGRPAKTDEPQPAEQPDAPALESPQEIAA
jgi:hypothetical protein